VDYIRLLYSNHDFKIEFKDNEVFRHFLPHFEDFNKKEEEKNLTNTEDVKKQSNTDDVKKQSNTDDVKKQSNTDNFKTQ